MNFGSRKNREGKASARSRVDASLGYLPWRRARAGSARPGCPPRSPPASPSMGRRTLLVDGDLGLANVDVQLGIAPETDLAAVIAGWVELEDAVCKVNGGAGSEIGFDVLPGRSGSGALAGLPAEEASRLAASLTALALQYDHRASSTSAPASKTTSCALPAPAIVAWSSPTTSRPR